MPNQRAINRKIVALWFDADFLAAVNRARKILHMDRSTFIRYAISEELRKQGIEFDEVHVYPPDRTGKGGPKPIKKNGRIVQMPTPAHEPEMSMAMESKSPYRVKTPARHP